MSEPKDVVERLEASRYRLKREMTICDDPECSEGCEWVRKVDKTLEDAIAEITRLRGILNNPEIMSPSSLKRVTRALKGGG